MSLPRVSQGTGSFVKKTVFGFSDSFAKFTGSVGKGVFPSRLGLNVV